MRENEKKGALLHFHVTQKEEKRQPPLLNTQEADRKPSSTIILKHSHCTEKGAAVTGKLAPPF